LVLGPEHLEARTGHFGRLALGVLGHDLLIELHGVGRVVLTLLELGGVEQLGRVGGTSDEESRQAKQRQE
jgi:hypothetical protein